MLSFLRSNHGEGGAAAQICIAAEFVGPSNECISLSVLGSFIDLLLFPHKGIILQVVMTEALLQLHSKSTPFGLHFFKESRQASSKPVEKELDSYPLYFVHLSLSFSFKGLKF